MTLLLATRAALLLSLSLSLLLPAALAVDPPRHPRQPTGNGRRLLKWDEAVTSRKIQPSIAAVRWVSSGGGDDDDDDDGQYMAADALANLVVKNIQSDSLSSRLLVPAAPFSAGADDSWLRHDQRVVLVATNSTAQYRYSYLADYFLWDVADGRKTALVDDQAGDIQYAELAPRGDAVVFVRHNDVFLRDGNGTVHRVTATGGVDVFNGVPDWVYEEEILQARSALWFSPDARYLAFLSLNETGVGAVTIPGYTAGPGPRPHAGPAAPPPPYPRQRALRYPKPGTANPAVQLNVLDMQTREVRAVRVGAVAGDNDVIIGEVAWVTDGHAAVVCRVFNRAQDRDKHVVVDPSTGAARVVRERDGSDGWLDNTRAIVYAGRLRNKTWYVDLSDLSGWRHLYLHAVDGSEPPVQLTVGAWEVGAVLHVDARRGLVYYSAATRHSADRHVYSVAYAQPTAPVPLVDDSVPAVWSASFSPRGRFYVLTYAGPDVPYQEVYVVSSGRSSNSSLGKNTSALLRTLTANDHVYRLLDEYALPNTTLLELRHPDGFALNVLQRLPPDFDPARRYPVLFTPYGGPGSQTVSNIFQPLNWEAYIASDPDLRFVTYTVDGRGTDSRGRRFRCAVARRLGLLEAQDQIWAARELIARNPFLDAAHVGIWGWSFGGFVAAKAIEADSGVFTFGLSTAPVTNWAFYDSLFVERYMKTPAANPDGYRDTAVSNATGFRNLAGAFSLMHGTADDNVHYQNTATLVHLLVDAGLSPDKLHMMAFTDSDHRIGFHGAAVYLYKFLTERLWAELQRVGPGHQPVHHQWSRKSYDGHGV